ncbi:MAG: NUDIX domain-containing protein [Reinekea sp.]
MNSIPQKCFSISCFLLRKRKNSHEVLLLLRAKKYPFGGEWCQVAGDIEDGDSAMDVAFREVFEETGISNLKLYSAMEAVFSP